LYLGLRAFHREWSLGVESKQSSMIGGLYCLLAIPSFVPHIIKVALSGLTLLIHLWDFTHVSNIFMYSMILRVRAQSICAIGCHHLCVIHGDLLLASPSAGCCQLVPSFANALGVFVLFQTSQFHLVWSNGSVSQASLFVVVVLISTILFSSCVAASFSWIFPCVHNRTYTKILLY
jgi:hypothetical protein